MRYVSAYMLAVLGGNASPAPGDIEKILSSVGIEAEKEKLNRIIADLSGKNLPQLIAQGRDKLCAMPSGGAPGPVEIVALCATAGEEKESMKEENKANSESEEDDMGFGLFD